jgi:tetratricopeptide (TPR) repeat protein
MLEVLLEMVWLVSPRLAIFILIAWAQALLPLALASQTMAKGYARGGEKEIALKQLQSLTYQGAFSQVRGELKQLQDKYPNDPDICLAAARFYGTIGSSGLALDLYKKASTLNSHLVEPYEGLASIYLAALDNTQALYYAQKALAIDPSAKQARLVLISALIYAGKLGEAGHEVAKAMAANKNHMDADFIYLAYKLSKERRELPYAKQCLDDAIKLKPEQTSWLIDRADLYESLHDYTAAKESLEKYLSFEPRSVEALYKLGIILEIYFHDFDGAVKQYRQILTIDPNYVAAITGLDRCKAKKNDVAGELKIEFWKSIEQLKESLTPARNLH